MYRVVCLIIIVIFHRALVQIEYPLERLMPLVHLFQEKYNDEVVPRILEVCIEMDKVRVTTEMSEVFQLRFFFMA